MATPLKVLFVSNFSNIWCGVAEPGRLLADALDAHPEVELTRWDATYSVIHESWPYIPADAGRNYDLVWVNWHPVTLNHITPDQVPSGTKLALFLHDIPPWSEAPLWDVASWRFAPEPCEGTLFFPYGCPPVCEPQTIVASTLGYTGVRGDGIGDLERAAKALGLSLQTPQTWLPTAPEVERLARCWINAAWYHEHRGQSVGVMTAAAAQRPLVISNTPKFSTLQPYIDELYQGDELVPLLERVMVDCVEGKVRIPTRLCEERSYARLAEWLVDWRNGKDVELWR